MFGCEEVIEAASPNAAEAKNRAVAKPSKGWRTVAGRDALGVLQCKLIRPKGLNDFKVCFIQGDNAVHGPNFPSYAPA